MAGSAHGDGEIASVHPDLQRFFHGEKIVSRGNRIGASSLMDGDGDDVAAHATLAYMSVGAPRALLADLHVGTDILPVRQRNSVRRLFDRARHFLRFKGTKRGNLERKAA